MFGFDSVGIESIVQFFRLHPYIGSLSAFVVAFLESMAVIGVIMPGAITMPAIGFLIGSSIIPAGTTFMWAAIGAILGDCVSYVLGVYFQNRIHRLWPFTRWPKLLERSEKFFSNHGGKSIFIGRFVGPMRAMIPMVAGVLKVPLGRFLLAALPSASIWSVVYMIPGVLLGAISLELPPKVATEFVVGAILLLIVVWLLVWLIQHFFRQIWQMIDYYIMQLWRFFQRKPFLSKFASFVSDPKEPDNHQQLTLVMIAFFLLGVLLFTLYQELHGGYLTKLSHAIYYLLSSIRVKWLDNVFIVITFLGDLPMLLAATGLIFLWLRWKKNWYTAIHWFFLVMLIGFATTYLKLVIYVPRPGAVLYEMHSSSFPSAHVALGTAIYGFLAVIIARGLKESKKSIVYLIATFLVSTIAFSRLYLGAHWLSDVIGAALIGVILVLFATVSYRRRHVFHFNVNEFIRVAVAAILVVWVGYSVIEFGRQAKDYHLVWPKQITTLKDLTKNDLDLKAMPLYRMNRLGRPVEALNLIYIGNLGPVIRALTKQGWERNSSKPDFDRLVMSLVPNSTSSHLSIFNQLYHNRGLSLLFTKTTKDDGIVAILRLWQSDLELVDSDLPVWIGDVERHHILPSIFSLKRLHNQRSFVGGTDYLAGDLHHGMFMVWSKYYPWQEHSVELSRLHWDGKLLIVKER